ncbi:unnamed protein product [Mytilus edulis]|uniref:Uncharacterized protein n=1 Tax=Mytilus edulis TaxID=6550 RepID=A0A8S3UIR1_MYTED|nr:unnamed protein product [Mytilus edulis]
MPDVCREFSRHSPATSGSTRDEGLVWNMFTNLSGDLFTNNKNLTVVVTDLGRYSFTCRNGVALPNTVVNCSDDGSRLAVTRIHNESSCNCKESISMKSSPMDLTIETTRAMESTIHTTSGMESTTETTRAMESNIDKSDMTDTEINKTIDDGIDFITTIDGETSKTYNNIPPESHIIL